MDSEYNSSILSIPDGLAQASIQSAALGIPAGKAQGGKPKLLQKLD